MAKAATKPKSEHKPSNVVLFALGDGRAEIETFNTRTGHRQYSTAESDPILDAINALVSDGRTRGHAVRSIAAASGVSTSTIYKWVNRGTRRPQNMTTEFVLHAFGYHRPIVRIK